MECEHAASYTARAVKKALPERSMLSKDARQTLNSAASMFTLYLSSIASENSTTNKRQTIVLKDVLQALRDMDFEHFIEPIEDCLRETKAAAALKKSKRGAEKPDGDAPGSGDEEELPSAGAAQDADDGDEEMQSAEDVATEEDDDEEEDAEAAGEEDEEDEEVGDTEQEVGSAGASGAQDNASGEHNQVMEEDATLDAAHKAT